MFIFRSYYSLPVNQEIADSQAIIKNKARFYILGSQMLALSFTLCLRYHFQLSRNPFKMTAFAGLSSMFLMTIFGFYKCNITYPYLIMIILVSDRIFQEIGKLPFEDFEKERQDIVNYCLPVDIE